MHSELFAIIEDPKGSLSHREFNPLTQKYEIVRNFTIPWPFHYGSLKGTLIDVDGEALDIAVFSALEAQTGQQMLVRIIGALHVKGGDHKVLSVCPYDDEFKKYFNYSEIPESLRLASVKVFEIDHSIERILNVEETMELVERCRI